MGSLTHEVPSPHRGADDGGKRATDTRPGATRVCTKLITSSSSLSSSSSKTITLIISSYPLNSFCSIAVITMSSLLPSFYLTFGACGDGNGDDDEDDHYNHACSSFLGLEIQVLKSFIIMVAYQRIPFFSPNFLAHSSSS